MSLERCDNAGAEQRRGTGGVAGSCDGTSPCTRSGIGVPWTRAAQTMGTPSAHEMNESLSAARYSSLEEGGTRRERAAYGV